MRFRPTAPQIGAAVGLFLAALAGAAWAVRVPPGETPYLKIAGSGFIFNYRVADAYYGFTAEVTKPVKPASIIEARFEDPSGGPPHLVTETVRLPARRYALRSPPLHGIRKDRPYAVDVRLVSRGDGTVLFQKSFTVTSSMSDEGMPTQPMTIGPGYAKNPSPASAERTPVR